MGAFLSTPVKDKVLGDGETIGLSFGFAEMQGWRRSMEDTHIAAFDQNKRIGLFAVFDGHCGGEVSKYCQNHFFQELQNNPNYIEGRFEKALEETFIRMDQLLESQESRAELEMYTQIAKAATDKNTNNANTNTNTNNINEDNCPTPTSATTTATKPSPTTPTTPDFQNILLGNVDDDAHNNTATKSSHNDDDGVNGGGEGDRGESDAKLHVQFQDNTNENGRPIEKRPSLHGQRSKSSMPQLSVCDDDDNSDDSPPHFTRDDRGVSHPPRSKKPMAESTTRISAVELLKLILESKRQQAGDTPGSGPSEPTPICTLSDHEVRAGATAITALLTPSHIYVANAGDSRAVLCRDGKAVPLSHDHKPFHDIERSRIEGAGGFIVTNNGQSRINGNLNLSRSIGDLKYKQNKDLPHSAQMITCQPDIIIEARTPQDEFIIIACDGIWDCMTNDEAVAFVRERRAREQGISNSQIVSELFDTILSPDPMVSRGIGSDNMTCVIVDLVKQQQQQQQQQ